jgi:hypothetical protein
MLNLANALLQLKKDRDQAQKRLGNWMRRLRLWPVSVAHPEDLHALPRPARGGGRYQRALANGSRRPSGHAGRSGEQPGATKTKAQGTTDDAKNSAGG